MIFYVYIIFVVCLFSYYIYRNILIYRKGKYDPHPFRKKETDDFPFWVRLIINFLVFLGASYFARDDRSDALTITFFVISLTTTINVIALNYLTYRKNKDKNIIIYTAIYAFIGIVFMILLLKLL